MASQYSAPVTATQVGSYFVKQYYQILQQQPDYAHQFYTDASSSVRVDGESTESASALLQIHTLITSLTFTAIEIKTLNSLESWNGGVLVVVSGSVKSKDFNGRRKFVQTFFLAPQDKGYFVLNDVFHFVNEDVIPHHIAPAVVEQKLDSLPITSSLPESTAVPDYDLEEEARQYMNSVHIDGDGGMENYSFQEHQPAHEYNIQEHQQEYVYGFEDHQQDHESESETEEEEEEETPVEESSGLPESKFETVQEAPRTMEEPVGEPQKLTYASILRARGNSAPSVGSQPALPKSTPPERHHITQPVVQQLNPVLPTGPEFSADVADEGLVHEGESKSVYVRNLPPTVSSLDIAEEFKNFGKIKPDGVFLRNRTDVGVCYAFVEFEDVQSVQNAIQASPIQLAGRQVYIEERRPNSNSASRGGRRGRGRGGRLGGRTFGRGSNQDGSDYYRARSNGFRGA